MFRTNKEKRQRRKMHVRKNIFGTTEKPRLFVFKSNRYMHVGLADDDKGVVVLGAKGAGNEKGAETLAKTVADKMKKAKKEVAVFDRSGYKYHGIIAKFVETLRANGIKI